MQSHAFPLVPQIATTARQHNFSAGPGALPVEVLEEIREELPVYNGVGASFMEISHRSAAYDAVHESAKQVLRELLGLGDEWHILFLQGGASLQFFQVPLNFLAGGARADYAVTGEWAKKAHKEAQYLAQQRGAEVRVAASSEDDNFNYIPDQRTWEIDSGARYLHFTSNNTIFGTQYSWEPEIDVPLVCDASSDFLSRSIDVSRYGLIYAGAQKNIGPAGVTAVLVRNDFLNDAAGEIPTMLAYRTHTGKLFNTPPVFAVYAVEKVLRWLKGQGGVEGMAEYNARKADLLYSAIDETAFYQGTAREGSRSKMNVTFRITDQSLEPAFIDEAKQRGLLGLKGHRSVGGLRASIYNACRLESVEALVSFMREFEQRYG